MNSVNIKYKQTLLFLSIYLLANLSLPLLEGVHFILHLGDETPLHSLQSHQSGTQHQHKTLAFLLDLDLSKDFSTDHTKNVISKKVFQYKEEIAKLTLLYWKFNRKIIGQNIYYDKIPYLPYHAPPPQ